MGLYKKANIYAIKVLEENEKIIEAKKLCNKVKADLSPNLPKDINL